MKKCTMLFAAAAAMLVAPMMVNADSCGPCPSSKKECSMQKSCDKRKSCSKTASKDGGKCTKEDEAKKSCCGSSKCKKS